MTLLRSLSFRLALLYLAVFTVSVLALGGLYYWVEVARPLGDLKAEIRQESAGLRALYRAQGADALALALERRAGAASPRLAYHALIGPDDASVSANLPSWPHRYTAGWKRIEADVAREGDEDEYEALVLDQQLPGGYRLLLGRDIDDIDELEESFSDTAIWIVPALLILGILGAALMSRAIAGRLDAISGSARAVIDGDMGSRIPVRGSGDDFDRLAATLNLMLDRLENSLEAVRRVSDSVAHELRTPLARLQVALADLQENAAGVDLGAPREEADRLQQVIDAVLRISRIEAGRHELALRPVDLSALLADALDFYAPEAAARGQAFAAHIPAALSVSGDRDLLFQGFANLIDNAVKFAPRGSTISVSAGTAGGTVFVLIANDGPPIPPDALPRLTERFFRTSPAAAEGLGLGLALVHAIAAAHRSALELRSAEGFEVEWRFPG